MKDGIRVEVTGYGDAAPMVRSLYAPKLNRDLVDFDIFELLEEIAARGGCPSMTRLGTTEWLRFSVDMGAPTTAE